MKFKTYPPNWDRNAVCVGVVFTTDLDTDRLFSNLQNLADLENRPARSVLRRQRKSFQLAVDSVLIVKVVWVFVV